MQEDLRELFIETAKTLSGRDCLVFFAPPISKGARGATYREGQTLQIIEIEPNQSFENMFMTLLHEAAHALYDYPAITAATLPSDRHNFLADSSVDFTQITNTNFQKYREEPEEILANQQMAIWAAFANQQVAKHIQPEYSEEMQIRIKMRALNFLLKRIA